jgi:LETM1-like protein
MVLGSTGWLEQIVRGVVGGWQPDVSSRSALEAKQLPLGKGRARRYVRGMLRESGLLFGTPNAPKLDPKATSNAEEQLFLAVLRVFVRIALDVAAQADAAPGPRPEQVLLLFAAMSGRLDDADSIHKRIEKAHKQWPLPQKLWLAVEEALEGRALSLASDPYYGLVLHNGAVYADAHLFGRIAAAYFAGSTFPRAAVERQVAFAAQQKARLVEVLVGLVTSERKPGFPQRRAILRQIDDLRLPAPLDDDTREFARKAFDKPVPLKRLTTGIRSTEMRRFLVEQTLLASLVDGSRSPREVEWTRELGKQLAFTDQQMHVMEVEMADFYRRHRDVVDVFSLSSGAEVMGEEWVDTMSTTMKKNYRALLKEIRETGELSKLLARAARGQKLNSAEKAAMRAQLIDVAKAVPALAIFAAPGGVLLLLALAKVLPFDLRPSSWREEDP